VIGEHTSAASGRSEEPSPQDLVRERLAAMVATDDQLRELVPSPEVRAALSAPGLSLGPLVATALEGYADRPALGFRDHVLETDATGRTTRTYLPTFSTISYGQLNDRVGAIAAALRHDEARPVGDGDFVATLAFSSPDCLAAEFAAFYLRAVSVPLQTNMAVDKLAAIVSETGPAVLFASCAYLDVAVSVAEAVGSLPRIVVIDHEGGDDEDSARFAAARDRLGDLPTTLVTLDELVEAGRDLPPVPQVSHEGDEDRMAVLLYTSGSTGTPKGAIYTEKLCKHPWLDGEQPGPKLALGWAPLNHMVGRNDVFRTLAQGGTTFFALEGDLSTFFDDIREVAPTSITLVPRVAEMMHRRYRQELLRAADQGDAAVAIRELLGGRLVSAALGSAPATPELLDFLKEGLGLASFYTGLGSTEAGNITLDDRINRKYVDDYRLRDVPESGYTTADRPFPRGELLIRTRTSVPGYFNSPAATAELFVDGYLATGDVVEERGPDHVVWVDRKNNVLKLSQGEYVTVGRLEALFANNSPLVHQIYLHGNSRRSYLVAVVVADRDEVERTLGVAATYDEIARAVHAELRRVAGDAGLAPYEIPRELLLEEEPFSVDNGLLSTLRKPLRGNLKSRYEDRLDALYEIAEERQRDGLQALADADDATVLDRIGAALIAVLGLADLDLDDPHSFRALGGDSLNAVELEALLADAFGVEVPAGVILGPDSSPRALAAHVEAALTHVGQPVAFAEVHPDAGRVRADELRLDRFVDLPAAPVPFEEGVPPRTILVTGANGYLGRFLCLEWLRYAERVDGRVVCLVRAAGDAEARARLEAVFDAGDAGLLDEFARLSERLDVLACELVGDRLGLDEATYDRLTTEVDHVVHGAALVNHTMAYRSLFAPNVAGTASMIGFALTGRVKSFDFVSSTAALRGTGAVAADTESGDIRRLAPEQVLSDDYVSGYGASKWAGEVLLREAHHLHGLPVNVYRSDMILAHSSYAGQINSADVFTRLLSSIVTAEIAPRSFYPPGASGAHYDGLPADFTAAAMQEIGARPHQGFRSLNFVNMHDDGVSLDRIVDWVISAGCQVERVDDYDEWFARFEAALEALPEEQRARSSLPVLAAYRSRRSPHSHVAHAAFAQAVDECVSVPVPHLTEEFVHKCLRDLRSLGHLS